MHPLLTHEIGSLAKPAWRVKTAAGTPLTPRDLEEAERWGKRLDVDGHDELVELLRAFSRRADEVDEVGRWSSRYAVRFLESAGLDWVYDGEQLRSEMYAWAVAHSEGFEERGIVRSFDNKYYTKSAVVEPPALRAPYHDDEFAFLRGVAEAELKVPVTGPYTIAVWSYDEHYGSDGRAPGAHAARAEQLTARRQFVLDLARDVIRPNLESLIGLGARWIQIDEPGASTEADELELFVEGFNASVDGLDGAIFSTHLCFSDYRLFFPAIEGMSACSQYCVGFANYDTRELGRSADVRPGYEIVGRFRDLSYEPALGVGVLDIHTDWIEPAELIRDRILYAVDVFGGPERIHVCPDCGLRTRSWEVAYEKLLRLREGVELAKSELGVSG